MPVCFGLKFLRYIISIKRGLLLVFLVDLPADAFLMKKVVVVIEFDY